MTEILTHAEYQAIAAKLDLPGNAFIDGKFQAGEVEKNLSPRSIRRPARRLRKDCCLWTKGCRFRGIERHAKRLPMAAGTACIPSERKQVLIRLAKLMKRNSHELAVMESIDSGKPVRDCAEHRSAGNH